MKLFNRILIMLLVLGILSGCSPAAPDSSSEDSQVQEIIRSIAQRNQVYDPADVTLHTAEDFTAKPLKSSTVLVYMVGSNLESLFGSATEDLLEMEQSGLDFKAHNLLVYTGGSCRWAGNVPSSQNSVLDLSLPSREQIVAHTDKNANMGAPETLSSFLNFAWENYPAEHVSLIFWDHGGGPLLGYGCDELFSNDSLSLAELVCGLEKTPFGKEQKLDLIGFDACLMSSLECMNLMSRYADYFVGFQELEPGAGWNYNFLNTLNQTQDPEALAASIIDSFADYYRREKTAEYDPPVTLSCISLRQISGIADALNAFSLELNENLHQGSYPQIQRARGQVRSFGIPREGKNSGYQYDLTDLRDLVQRMDADSSRASQNLLKAIKKAVIYNYSNTADTCGISIYYPFHNKSQFSRSSADYKRISPALNYSRFLSSVAGKWQDGQEKNWKLGELSPDGKDLIFQLTDEQKEEVISAYYTVLQKVDGYTFCPVLSQIRVYPDQNGRIRIPADPCILALQSETGSRSIWPARQISADRKGFVYEIVNSRLFTESYTYQRLLGKYYRDRIPISVLVRQDLRSNEARVLTVSAQDQDVTLSGKNTLDSSRYEGLSCSLRCAYPRRDAAGAMLPAGEWSRGSDLIYSKSAPISSQIHFSMIPCSQFSREFVIQLELEDANNECYGSELTPAAADPSLETLATPGGQIHFRIHENNAEICDYSGADEVLILPGTLKGKPVVSIGGSAFSYTDLRKIVLPKTVTSLGEGAFGFSDDLEVLELPKGLKTIGDLAFIGCSSLEKIVIPESVTHIGKEAFELCSSLTDITLPSALTFLGESAFRDCKNLKHISVSENSTVCAVRDDVLYTPDYKTLLAFPAAREGDFSIPQGTEKIASGAFSLCSLKTVTFPDSLKEIGNYSFAGSRNLQVPRLPGSLRSIGFHAFGSQNWQPVFKGRQEQLPEIYIGQELRFLGDGAFDGFGARRFTVSPQNPIFSERGGNLCNGAGDSLIDFCLDGTPVVKFPEGIREFDWDRLSFLETLYLSGDGFSHFELYFPQSLSSFTGEFQLDDSVILYAPENSYAASYLSERRIPFLIGVSDSYRTIQVPTPQGTASYRLYSSYAMLEDYQGTDLKWKVPASVQNLPVKVIGNGIYSISSDVLEELTLPEGVEILNRDCLSIQSLRKLSLPDSIRRIESGALRQCGSANLSKIPESLQYLGPDSLGICSTEVFRIPRSLTDISPEALLYLYTKELQVDPENPSYSLGQGLLCSKDGSELVWAPKDQTEIQIPEGIRKIGDYAFSGSIIQHLEIPDSVSSIGNHAFSYCYALENFKLPERLTFLGENAFGGCSSLRSIAIPGTVEEISDSAFSGCTGLEEILINEGVSVLGAGCFRSAEKIHSLSLPESLTAIRFGALGDAYYPTAPIEKPLYLGKNIADIGENPFAALTIEAFSVSPDNPSFQSSDGILLTRDGIQLIACPSGKSGSVHIPDGVKVIRKNAFGGCRNIEDLWIPDSVEEIEDAAAVFYHEGGYQEDISYSFTIHCSSGSFAEQYAKENKIPYLLN